MESAAEIKRLQNCINDLISVLALPAIWSGSESSQILGTLLESLQTMLRLDFAYARLNDASDGPPIEVLRFGHHQNSSVQPQQFGQALDRWLTSGQTTLRSVIPNPAGEGEVSIASFSLGLQHEGGVLVAGSRRADFPTEVERLLLRVAANQAAIGLQEARRSGEQKQIAEVLEQRVAERTKRLTAVNDELRRSEAYLAEAQRLSRTGSFGWRPSTGEIHWSEESFRIFQHDRTTKPTVELALERVHPEDLPFVKQAIERASKDGKDFDFEYRLLMPDGLVKHVHIVAHGVCDEPGSIEFVGAVMDVTEQHQAKAALEKAINEIKKSEERLRLVIDTIPSMVWSGLPDGTFDFINQPWLTYLGCSWDELSARGGLRSVVHPNDVEGSDASWNVTRTSGRHTDHELRMRRADGQYCWFLTRALPLRDEQGNIVRWYGTATDIEARKRAEEALRRSEHYLAEAQRLSHTGSWALSAGSEIAAYWSEEDFRIWGFDPQQGLPSLGRVFQRIHPEDAGRVNEKSRKALREKTDYTDEFRIVRPDGEVRHIHTLAHPVLSASGEIVEYIGTHVDVTERKRAEDALRERAGLLDLTHDTIFVRDIDDVITYWNRGAAELYGWTSEEATGQVSHRLAQTVFPAPLEEINRQLLDTGRWEGELIHAKRDGTRVVVASRWALQRDEQGNPAAILETNNDITERKRAEEEQKHSAEALRQAEADLAHVSRVTTMGELTASLAHEVNQPITAAVTNAKTCVRWLAADTPNIEEARDAALRSARNGTRAAEIISRIRLLFQKGTPKREAVDINEVVREIIVLLHSEATRYSISVQAELGTGLPELMGDSVQLQQVFMNLFLNGIEAMKDVDGKRELFIKSERWEDEQVLVSVHDTGSGLPPQQADRIFNAFFTTKLHGTGMGLSISRSIVESHGGRLWTDGTSPHGATFHIALPTRVEAH
jgi:PAS domain S-box-containing protein